MSPRWKKLIGLVALVFGLIVYVLLAMRLGVALPDDTPFVLELAYYVVAGVAWAFPCIPLIRWMNRPAR
ncbi:MAG: DUF2842 domain-containing protein [Alphaproteobacteria bacterium]|nr:DUF2842 domain-containing protein [Alphaproteobacteria bacterium]MDX5367864.1 DUF2842 domain-containing protein [Alphaproteobacteria bacterium]MDX5462734.1 DUF2842 domain-containing protein [Alphaproteobacteria bacterium]